jgi:predicted nuclease of predicted toxin-antitoxin system
MAVALLMDHNVPRAITIGLRLRAIDVLTAYEDKSNKLDDTLLLDRANALARVLFTQDDDLLVEATRRQKTGIIFQGVIYAHQLRVPIRKCVDDLELIAKAAEPEDLINQIVFLPL